MRATATLPNALTPESAHDHLAYRLAGLSLAAVLPALFWTILASGISKAAGFAIPASALILAGAAITLFLGAVCAPIILKPAH